MSWIVQHLLKNRVQIKTVPNIESDEYNNLIVLENKIDELYAKKLLTNTELLIINSMSDGKPIKDLEAIMNKTRLTISRMFTSICNRLAYSLGGYFTDDGFLQNLRDSYRLSDEEIDKIKLHMSGRFKHKLKRKIKKWT